jgi:hypothetical protein
LTVDPAPAAIAGLAPFFFANAQETAHGQSTRSESRIRALPPPLSMVRIPVFPPCCLVVASAACLWAGTVAAADSAAVLQRYCLECHDSGTKKGDVSLEGIDLRNPAANPELWERVVRKLHHREMPPQDEERPDEATYQRLVAELSGALDRAAAAAPNPGRTESLRRLNRTEYQNAIRDLLAL